MYDGEILGRSLREEKEYNIKLGDRLYSLLGR
jgi:hypothetical protein